MIDASKLRTLAGKGVDAWLNAVLVRIPGQPIKSERYLRFQTEGIHAAGSPKFSEAFVRLADIDDIDLLVACNRKRGTFLKRLELGDSCLAAFENEHVIGYEWFSSMPEHVEERFGYRFAIPTDSLYAYDAYVLERYRGKGVWRQLILAGESLMRNYGRRRLIAHIDHGNLASISAHRRVGFKHVSSHRFIEVFGRQWLLESPVTEQNGSASSARDPRM